MSKLELPFSLDEEDTNEDEYIAVTDKRFAFWNSSAVIGWFQERGYTLYTRQRSEEGILMSCTIPTLPSQDFCVVGQYPYAYHDNFSKNGNPLLASEQMGKVLFAQDSDGRHVAIKLVRDNSDELRILQFLHSQGAECLKEHCILPILDFLPLNNHQLVVMPRWGTWIHLPSMRVRDALHIMRSMLKALRFLHNHNIIHRDLKFDNMAINHFSDMYSMSQNRLRAQLRDSENLVYGIFDFDVSLTVPPNADKRSFRLPYQMSWCGTFSQPRDTRQGEFDYDPFAFDVGTLGREFCSFYQHLTKDVPMLAPLFDKMTTRHVPSRFTAAEALQFLETLSSELNDSQLNNVCMEPQGGTDYEIYDRWQHLSPEFKQKWAAFREPPVPVTTKLLRRICENDYMMHFVPWARWCCYTLWTNPRHLFASLFRLTPRS